MQPPSPTDDQKTPSEPTTSYSRAPESSDTRSSPGLKIASFVFRAAVIFGVLAIAIGIVVVLTVTAEKSAHSDEELPPMSVRVIEAQPQFIDRTWNGYGTTRSMNDANVVAEVGGRVIERPVSIEPGKEIDAGTVLLRLDTSDYTNALNAANQAASAIEAQLNGLTVESERVGTQIELAKDEIDAAQRDLDRTQQAIDAGAGSIGEVDAKTAAVRRVQREVETLRERFEMIPSRRAQLLAQLAAQRANAATAQENLDRSVIRSPIAGVIQSVNARRGDWVALGTPVARVVDVSRLEIPLQLPVTATSWIGLGNEVQLWEGEPNGDPDKTGMITRIAPEADSGTRTITVFVEVEQDARSADVLKAGRFVMGRVHTPDDRPRFVVPRRVVQGGRVMIAIEQDNGESLIEPVAVEVDYSIDGVIESLDANEDQWTVLQSGLNGGELIVVSLLDQIHKGLMVNVIDPDSETKPTDIPEEDTENSQEQP
ncbi:MAG: efflux RND transporter periplasmic adaptor subunit [Phycisphaerales bacterium]